MTLDCKHCDYGQIIHIIESENVLKTKPTASDYRNTKVLLKEFGIDCIVPEFESVCALLRWGKKEKLKKVCEVMWSGRQKEICVYIGD